KNVDYREANKRAGYVYVISNIGAFGDDVYKIGMTRRLDPMERIDELGDASVPFDYDVHALIFSDDAPALESALHNAFEANKVNKINSRREFFKISLNEIKAVVAKNFDKTVEWIDVPEAEQYRLSIARSKNKHEV
ncbi:MAG: GIY-YIG nuclease family protein, partial [Firmicutes bacterium]|nr:GIY-YIG nuclease family protein [Bacillota bacterium]